MSRNRVVTFGVCLSLALPLYTPTAKARAAEPAPSQPTVGQSVPGRPLTARRAEPDPDGGVPESASPVWPVAAWREARLAAGEAADVGDGSVRVSVEPSAIRPVNVRAENLGPDRARTLGADGMAVAVTRDGPVRLTLRYGRFAHAYGGDYAHRLTVLRVPECALMFAAEKACPEATVTPAVNNATQQTLTLDLPDAAGTEIFAVASGTSGNAGDYRASDISIAQAWEAGQPAGDFDYDYPLELPPPPAGQAPNLALRYDSGSVDGRTSAGNGQASWIGMGWDLNVGFIERKYKACGDDGHASWGDFCWHSPYANNEDGAMYVMSLNGHTTELIKGADGQYHAADDQGYKIEHRFDGVNDDNTGEYWKVSTLDGHQYFFGYGVNPYQTANNKTNSAWTVPVIGDDSGEPCNNVSTSTACNQAYRWMLDRDVDPNENAAVYFYTTETNKYKRTATGGDFSYVRGGYLRKVEYGYNGTTDVPAPNYVDFKTALRCKERTTVIDPDLTPPAACPGVSANPSSYPDVPTDLICTSGCSKNTPTFFTVTVLSDVSTYARKPDGSGYDKVTKYQLRHGFPSPGDGTDPALWLDWVRRIGYTGDAVREAVTNFNGSNFNNRVDYNTGLGVPQLAKRRVISIWNELGGQIGITYGHANGCPTGGAAASGFSTWWNSKNGHWDVNTQECFPQYFKPEGAAAGWGIFHKYVTTDVREMDHVGGSPDQLTHYDYLGGGAWRKDDDLMTPGDRKSWNMWRGYASVRTTEGTGPNTERSVHVDTYFRGLDGDETVSGGTKAVTVTDYDGTAWNDFNQRRGLRLQTRKYRFNTDGSYPELASERYTYWDSGLTADGPGTHNARMMRPAHHLTRTALDGGAWRITDEVTVYDSYGVPISHDDWGQTGIADNVCTTYTYARNVEGWRWMINYPETVEKRKDNCTGAVLGRQVTLYDGASAPGATTNKPFDGNPTEVRTNIDAATVSVMKRTFDGMGRVTSTTDPLNNTTTTVYNPATGFPSGGVTVTNPLGHQEITWPSRFFDEAVTKSSDANGRVTEIDYDGVGRTVRVWLPTEPRSGGVASQTFSYDTPYSGVDAPTASTKITTRQLQSAGVQLTGYTFHDGFGRDRETQSASPAGGQVVTAKWYDGRGLEVGESEALYNSGSPGTALLNPAQSTMPQYTLTQFDALERPIATIDMHNGAELWRTTTSYHGDHIDVTPPFGGKEVTYQDVHGKPTRIQNYWDATTHFDTTYTYTPLRQVATITDPTGNVTNNSYNWVGSRTVVSDPDSGTSTTEYDLAGRQKATTDAKGQKLSTVYDALGRRSELWAGDPGSGTRLAQWSYDAAGQLGLLASNTSYAGGQAYRVDVTGYDARDRVTGRKWTIPASEGALAGSYQFTYGYDSADHPTTIGYPAAGGLSAETVTQAYSSLGMPTTLTGAATYVAATGYTSTARLSTRDYGSASVRRSYGYDANTARLASIQTSVNSTTVQNDSYTYDAVGNVRSIVDNTAGQRQCFGYDGRSRLFEAYTTTAGACGSGGDGLGPAPYRLNYAYDASGSIANATRDGTNSTHSYPGQGAGSVRPHAVTAIGANTYGYDQNGHLSTRTVAGVSSTLAWDQRQLLASVNSSAGTTSFVYDADGGRLLRRTPAGNILFLDRTELKLTGTVVTGTRYYSSGATVATRTSSGVTWLFADQQGSQQLSVNASSGAVSRQRYLPFGAPRGATNQLPTERGFLGKVEDDSTGLVALDARYYDPAIGKFISPDPIDNTDPDLHNPYAYAANNPVTLSDPTGLTPCLLPGDCPGHRPKPRAKPKSSVRKCDPRHCAAAINHFNRIWSRLLRQLGKRVAKRGIPHYINIEVTETKKVRVAVRKPGLVVTYKPVTTCSRVMVEVICGRTYRRTIEWGMVTTYKEKTQTRVHGLIIFRKGSMLAYTGKVTPASHEEGTHLSIRAGWVHKKPSSHPTFVPVAVGVVTKPPYQAAEAVAANGEIATELGLTTEPHPGKVLQVIAGIYSEGKDHRDQLPVNNLFELPTQ